MARWSFRCHEDGALSQTLDFRRVSALYRKRAGELWSATDTAPGGGRGGDIKCLFGCRQTRRPARHHSTERRLDRRAGSNHRGAMIMQNVRIALLALYWVSQGRASEALGFGGSTRPSRQRGTRTSRQ